MLVKSIVNRPTTLLTIFLLLVGFGLYVALDLPIDLYPEVTPPVLNVTTTYPGAGPEEVEKVITRLVESVLSNASGLEKISSSSSEGASQVTLEFTYGTNMDEASNDVRDKLERIKRSLPSEASLPQIFKFDTSMIPILNLMVKGNRSPEELRELAEKSIVPRIEQVAGVAMASIRGGRDRAVMIEIPQNRLEAYNLTITQIAQMLKGQNIQVPAGSITEGSKDYLIRTAGEYKSIEEIKNTVIAYRTIAPSPGASGSGLRTILLRDIANVFDSYKRDDSRVFIDGQPGVYISVQKQSGKNSVQTADNVLERLPRIMAALPRDISLEVLNDTTKIIRSSLASVSSSAVTGGLLAVLILFIFLRSFKTTFIIATAIPVSIIVTLMCMYLAGLTLNLMTLTGLALGIGMLVDNSIVILENIYRYREKGAKLTTAAMLGGTEMILPIAGSTLTTIVVFAPIVVFKKQLGFMGEMLSAMSFTIVISLSISLIVAVLLVPILASKYLPISSRKEDPLKGIRKKFDDLLGGFFDGMDRAYKGALGLMLKHRVVTILAILAVFAGSLLLIPLRGFEFMPTFEEDAVNVNIELPIGTKLDITETVLKQIELVVREEVKGFNNITITAGSRTAWGMGAVQTHRGSISIRLPAFKERIDSANIIKNKLRRHFNDFPSVVFSFRDSHGFGGSNASPIDVIIRSNDLVKGKAVADQIRELIGKNVKQVTEPVVSLKDGLPQVEILIDRNKAYDLGLNITAIGTEIQANIDGIISSKYRTEGTEYDIVAILDPLDRSKLPDIDKIFVMNSAGKRIPLASIAHYERTTGPLTIQRESQGRIIHVTGGIVPGTDIQSTEMQIRDLIAREIPANENIVIEFSGDYANIMKFGGRLLILFIISILLVYGIMAALFENFLDPFIILFTMPLTATGVIVIHILTNLNFSMFTLIGLITLAGVVVNNGIVLVDYTNLMRKRGMKLFDAIPYAGGHRLRPVLMTSLTTMLALVPLAFDKGEGLDLIRPIGLTILGGMSVSTFFTLFLIPLIYSYFMQYADKLHLKRAAKWQKKMEIRRETLTRALASEHQQHEEPKEGSA